MIDPSELPSAPEVWLRAWCARATVKNADTNECTIYAGTCLADFDREWAPQPANARRSQAAPEPEHLSVKIPVRPVEIDGMVHSAKIGVAARGHFLGREFFLVAGDEEALDLVWQKIMSTPLDMIETGLVSVRRYDGATPPEAPNP